MKKKIKLFMVIFIMIIASMYFGTSVQAAQKNVTNTYKKQATKILRGFDGYLGYCCGENEYFRYDAYAKTTMVYLKNLSSIYNKSTAYAKKKLLPQMRLYFNISIIKLKKYTNYKFAANPSYLIRDRKGKVAYIGGDWGTQIPRGIVRKILKNGSDYEVTYNLYLYDIFENKYVKFYYNDTGLIGSYRITMRKASNKNGFYIKNIKQIYSAKISL